LNKLNYLIGPKLSYYVAAIIVQVDEVSGGQKSHPYLFGEISFVVAGFIPACNGQLVEEIAQFSSYLLKSHHVCA
jgi:hypothetical protein